VEFEKFPNKTAIHEARAKHKAGIIDQEAKAEMNLTCGGSSIEMTPGGITIKASKITLEGPVHIEGMLKAHKDLWVGGDSNLKSKCIFGL
jgi:hypothetical protein